MKYLAQLVICFYLFTGLLTAEDPFGDTNPQVKKSSGKFDIINDPSSVELDEYPELHDIINNIVEDNALLQETVNLNEKVLVGVYGRLNEKKINFSTAVTTLNGSDILMSCQDVFISHNLKIFDDLRVEGSLVVSTVKDTDWLSSNINIELSPNLPTLMAFSSANDDYICVWVYMGRGRCMSQR